MKVMTFATIVAMACTLCSTLTMLVLCMASGANASEAQIRTIKAIMIGFSLLGVSGIAIGVFLLRSGQHGWALGSSITPTFVMVAVLLVALAK